MGKARIMNAVHVLKGALEDTGFPEDNTSLIELIAVTKAHLARLCQECEGHGKVVLKGSYKKCKMCDGTGRTK